MNNTQNTHSTNVPYKIRSSLVIKLNLRMLGRVLSGFLAVNILILLMGGFIILWKSEEGAKYLTQGLDLPGGSPSSTYHNYRIFTSGKPISGIKLPQSVQESLPLKISDANRNIIISEIHRNAGLRNRIDSIKYVISFSSNDVFYEIVYALGSDLWLFLSLFSILLIFEALIIIGNIGKGSRMIKKTLKPLSDLSEIAKSLNAEVSTINPRLDRTHIKDLTGVISSIDANKLDRRITMDSSQDELEDLTFAINGMLNRIHNSYQSQIRFVSDASHELRTPISVIQGYINLLDRWGKNDQKTMQESIDAIKGETGNMKDLVEQLLFLARGDNETISLHREELEPCGMIEEIAREARLIDSNHLFELDLNGPAILTADRQLLKQAIRILVDNSIKFTPQGEKIILRVIKNEGHVYIVVQDSGTGISSEDLPHIFDRFYRSDESRARDTGGSGLGLSIAKWIVERHGAHFEILSRIGIGTRITIIFPSVTMLPPENHEEGGS